MIELAIIAGGLYVGGNIGANDAANCIGPSVGAGLVRVRFGIALVAVCALAGALLQGQAVAKTIGKGIVEDPLSMTAVLAALFCGGLLVTAATVKRIPVSTSQAIVGSVAGVGLASGHDIAWGKTLSIVGSWVLCPMVAMVTTLVLYRATLLLLERGPDEVVARRVLHGLVLASGAYAAYSLGANNLGNAIGPILSLEAEVASAVTLTVLGAGSISLGALLFSRGVIQTVGSRIVELDLPSAFAVQVASGFGLHLFSMMGIPVSTSQAVIGALIGVGLVQGIRTVSVRKLTEIAVGWIVTPVGAGLLAWGALRLVG